MIKGEELKIIVIDEGKPIATFKGNTLKVKKSVIDLLRNKY
jgi:hypothetical protein